MPWHMDDIQAGTFIGTVAQVDAGLLAAAITLVAIVPALLEIARGQHPGFLQERAAKRSLQRSLRQLRIAVVAFGGATLSCAFAIFFPNIVLLLWVILVSAVALLI